MTAEYTNNMLNIIYNLSEKTKQLIFNYNYFYSGPIFENFRHIIKEIPFTSHRKYLKMR